MSDSSENEMPEVISSGKMKSEREKEILEMFSQKRKIKEELKLKRKLKAETFAVQKKEKELRAKLAVETATQEFDAEDLKEEDEDDQLENSKKLKIDEVVLPEQQPSLIISDKKETRHKKIYPKYNVEVDALSTKPDPRATAALNFREKRMAKVHREKVASTLLSYREKIKAKTT